MRRLLLPEVRADQLHDRRDARWRAGHRDRARGVDDGGRHVAPRPPDARHVREWLLTHQSLDSGRCHRRGMPGRDDLAGCRHTVTNYPAEAWCLTRNARPTSAGVTNKLTAVELIRPPITASASGRCSSAPTPRPRARGVRPATV